MSDLTALRDLYQPLQPSIEADPAASMNYREYPPSDALGASVYCYWRLWPQTERQSPYRYRIVSDGCIDLLLNCSTFGGMVVAGTADAASLVELERDADYFGIRFLPGGFHCFFSEPLKHLANRMLPSREAWGNRLAELETRLFEPQSVSGRIAAAESFLLQRLKEKNPKPGERRFQAALGSIYRRKGRISLSGGAIDDISPRQLRRLFHRHVGVAPKTFARIVRFQSALRALARPYNRDASTLHLDFGYYDQPHFIHEFNRFYGLSPSAALFS